MKCERPFLRRPMGITEREWLTSQEARDAATPFPCGRCEPCRINKARMWKHRILLESRLYSHNAFVTLTYKDENLPQGGTLVPDDLTTFFKRLRRSGRVFRYFAVGEYGEKSERPHYHVIMFGVECGLDMERAILKAWGLGFIQMSPLSHERAGYITGYVVKGMTGRTPYDDGRVAEFMRCSKMESIDGVRKGCGIGKKSVERIADNLVSQASRLDLTVVPVNQLTHGKGNTLPLGRYLSTILNSKTGAGSSMAVYQEDLQAHYDPVGRPYVDAIVEPDSPLRIRQKERARFYKKGKPL